MGFCEGDVLGDGEGFVGIVGLEGGGVVVNERCRSREGGDDGCAWQESS